MRDLSWAEFSESVGSTYLVGPGDGPLALTLERAAELAPSARAAGSFRLEFRGPAAPILEQATYSLHHGDAAFEMFIVPIAQDARGTLYEAIFN
jgi:hypothetical protein